MHRERFRIPIVRFYQAKPWVDRIRLCMLRPFVAKVPEPVCELISKTIQYPYFDE
jgi:hypothetical protein